MDGKDILELLEILDKDDFGFVHGDEIILTSKSCPEYEITLYHDKDDHFWYIGVDPTPFSEDTMSGWYDREEFQSTNVYNVTDWTMDPRLCSYLYGKFGDKIREMSFGMHLMNQCDRLNEERKNVQKD